MSAPARVILRPREEDRILLGHPWVYDNEIDRVEGDAGPGDAVDVESSRRRYLGRGYINPHSKIRVRILTRSKEGIDHGFWKRRMREALAYRKGLFDPERDSFRLLFGEADGAAGLVLDLYRDHSRADAVPGPLVAVVQLLSLGADARRDDIIRALREALQPDFVMERSDAPVRALEGLGDPVIQADPGTPTSIIMREEGILLTADLGSGQKTGSFLDQGHNRAAAGRLAGGLRVLDAFCNSGGFGLQALRNGAASVDFVDSQDEALCALRANLELNGHAEAEGRARAISANAFDFLRDAERRKERYGMVVLDPPAFAKSRDQVEGAHRGYREINVRALSLLDPGGWLVTCSCSHHFGSERFQAMLAEAARDAGRVLRMAEIRHQRADHPIRAGYPESHYLKCVIARVD